MDRRATVRGELIDSARAALRVGDAARARHLLDEAAAECPNDPQVQEGLARAAYLERDLEVRSVH